MVISGDAGVPVAQLVEHWVIMREVVSSTPTLRVLKITEQEVLPL